MTKRRAGGNRKDEQLFAVGAAADVFVSDILPIVIVGPDPTIHA